MTTLAPPFASASTIALPMPLLPPVTIATLPVRLIHCSWCVRDRPNRTMRCRTVCTRITARDRATRAIRSPSLPSRGARPDMSVFPPIAEYAFLSDCEVSTLVAPDGSVEWLCLPRPDSPSVFGALLDRAAGNFHFGPTGIDVPNQRRYVPGTNVLETTWHTPTGWLIVWDLLVMGPAPIDERR